MSTRVHVHTTLQPDYSYELVAPMGKQFDPLFMPQLTPQEMLEAGVFDGWYFRGEDAEYPRAWFQNAKLAHSKPDSGLNFFKVHASQSISVWRAKGWIYPDDPHGWFEWYCRYYMGRRIPEEDARQIKRWYMMRRHIAQIVHNCRPGDLTCRRRQRQALLHWAYDSRV